jgi:hypothetical protein
MAPHRRPSPSGSTRALVVVATLVVGTLWVTVKHPLEGPIIFVFSVHRGVHATDPLALVPVAIAIRWWRKR